MTISEYLTLQPPNSHWKRDARRLMQGIVRQNCTERGTLDPAMSVDALIARIDAAYPFGSRERHPYRCWLEERKLLHSVLRPKPEPLAPTRDDEGAVEVATDLMALADELERIGRKEEAAARRAAAGELLDRQAPNRLNRACPVCGAKVGKPCVDVEKVTSAVPRFAAMTQTIERVVREPRLIPHLSRVERRRDLFGVQS